jgi:glutamate racemase
LKVDFVFLDSGTGGIPYLLHLKKQKPEYTCAYYADTANFPYGEKTNQQIIDCVKKDIINIRQKFNPEVIVIACNTMSVNALIEARKQFPNQKIVGTVPAIKLAASLSKKKIIGLLATKSTVENPYNIELQQKFASDCKLVLRDDAELISFIEHFSFLASESECIHAVEPAVDFFRKNNCDVIILGCTHFLNLSEIIQKVAGNDIKVIDSRDGVVKRALSIIDKKEKIISNEKSKLYVTGFTQKKDKDEYLYICKINGFELIE